MDTLLKFSYLDRYGFDSILQNSISIFLLVLIALAIGIIIYLLYKKFTKTEDKSN